MLLGFVERADDNALYNSALLVSARGELVAVARKTALTDTDAQWASYGRGAKSMPVVELPPIGRVGIGICKDMSAVTTTSMPGEHAMDESFRRANTAPLPIRTPPRPLRVRAFRAALVDRTRAQGGGCGRHRRARCLGLAGQAGDRPQQMEGTGALSHGHAGGRPASPRHRRIAPYHTRTAQVSKHLGTPTLLIVADQSGSDRGVPYAGSSVVMDLLGPSTLAQLSEAEEGLLVQARHARSGSCATEARPLGAPGPRIAFPEPCRRGRAHAEPVRRVAQRVLGHPLKAAPEATAAAGTWTMAASAATS